MYKETLIQYYDCYSEEELSLVFPDNNLIVKDTKIPLHVPCVGVFCVSISH